MAETSQSKIGLTVSSAGFVAAVATVWYFAAWQVDDAFISYRVVEQWGAGHGLVWNATERVQVYTHPLWVLLLLPFRAIGLSAEDGSYILSFTCTLFCVPAAWWATSAHTIVHRLLVVVGFLGSIWWLDYSSSGLETPLLYALDILLMGVLLKDDVWNRPLRAMLVVNLLISLLLTARYDHVVLCLFFGLLALRRGRAAGLDTRSTLLATTGFAPLAAWVVFSTVYYGSPYPNTYYAKLSHPPHLEYMLGWAKTALTLALKTDPWMTVVLIVCSLLSVLDTARSRATLHFFLAVAGWFAYQVWIGGDWMVGRMPSIGFTVAWTAVSAWLIRRDSVTLSAGTILFVLALQSISVRPFWSHTLGTPESAFTLIGNIQDARMSQLTGSPLLKNWRFRHQRLPTTIPPDDWQQERGGLPVATALAAGRRALGVLGNDGHVVDQYGLCDPLLARMPSWELGMVGHRTRPVPEGYLSSVSLDKNVIEDDEVRTYYEHVRRLTRGPLFTWDRWKSIWHLLVVEPELEPTRKISKPPRFQSRTIQWTDPRGLEVSSRLYAAEVVPDARTDPDGGLVVVSGNPIATRAVYECVDIRGLVDVVLWVAGDVGWHAHAVQGGVSGGIESWPQTGEDWTPHNLPPSRCDLRGSCFDEQGQPRLDRTQRPGRQPQRW